MKVTDHVDDFGRTLGEELLTPTRIYAKDCLDVVRSTKIHAMSHITGGGLANNLARVIPDGLTAHVDRGTWTPQPIFSLVQQAGQISREDIEETLNMGVGMVMICPEASLAQVIALLGQRGVTAWDAGGISARAAGEGAVVMHGNH